MLLVREVYCGEIIRIVKSLRNGNLSGSDGLQYYVIKRISPKVAEFVNMLLLMFV